VEKAKKPEEKKEGDVAMEGGEAKEGEEAPAAEPEMEEVTKTVVKRNSVPVAASASWGMSEAELAAAKEHEFDMALVDKLQEETNNAKNDLEAYVLSMRSKLSDQLSGFVDEASNEALRSELTAAEDWLYDEGEDTTKGVYAEKLAGLRAKGDPIQRRYDEYQERPAAASALSAVCAKYAELAASSAPEYAHISEDDRAKVKGECDAAAAWLAEKKGYQDAMGKHEEPILTVAELVKKAETVERVCHAVMSQPAPKVEPPKKEEEDKMEDAVEEMPEDANGMETDEPAAPEAPTMETD
jgi:heat shock protein 4